MSTRTLLEYRLLNPRMLMAQAFESTRATSTPGAMRRRSGMFIMPDRRISSCVITKTAAPALERAWSASSETEVT